MSTHRSSAAMAGHCGESTKASTACSVWVQTSPSGCHSGSCGTPTIAANSGKRSSHPLPFKKAKPSDGCTDRVAHLSHSSRTRSTASSAKHERMDRHSSSVSGAAFNRKRPANCMPRNTRNGSSGNAALVCLRMRASRSERPPWGSISAPLRGSQSIELMVKSRRAEASSGLSSGSNSMSKPLCPGPRFESRRGTEKSQTAPLEWVSFTTPNDLPTESARPCRDNTVANSGYERPYTSRSKSATGTPSNQSRTHPPTK